MIRIGFGLFYLFRPSEILGDYLILGCRSAHTDVKGDDLGGNVHCKWVPDKDGQWVGSEFICSMHYFRIGCVFLNISSAKLCHKEDLVAQMQSNKAMGTDTELTLVFERDLSESPRPPEVLDPVEAE